MPDESMAEALRSARNMMVDLERHLDCAALDNDLEQAARAWVRVAQMERVLRAVLPADVTADARAEVRNAPSDA